VGHGCAIGDHSTLCAQVALGGSTELGRLVTMAGAAKSAGHLRMGDGSVVAGMSGVSSDLEDGSRVAGVPHVELSVWLRMAKALPRVPELLRRVRRLEQRLAADDEATD
jgi:UDP-3-O-[3-hydroxymyristoyl] glucosamine N-acyltransferase